MGRKGSIVAVFLFALIIVGTLVNCTVSEQPKYTIAAKPAASHDESTTAAIVKPEDEEAMDCYVNGYRVPCGPMQCYVNSYRVSCPSQQPPNYGGQSPNCSIEYTYAEKCVADVYNVIDQYGHYWVSGDCCDVFRGTQDCLQHFFHHSRSLLRFILQTCALGY